MKKANVLKIATISVISALCAFALSGCFSGESESTNEALQTDTGLTGGIAATVNGVEIEEDKVTRYINNFRIRSGYEEDEDWKEYLKNTSNTPESVRDEILDTMIDQELTIQCAEERGVSTNDEEIQSYVDKMRANYSSDEAWQTALEGAGFDDEEAYREALNYSILDKKLDEQFEEEAQPDEAKLVEEGQSKLATYDGAKKSSHILFSEDDEELAQQVLDQLRNGEIDFAAAAAEYSTDTGSAQDGGNVGWDKLTTFVTEYQNALEPMAVGDISDLVKSEYGYHIITVTDEFNAPETLTSSSQLPEEMLEEIKSGIVDTSSDDLKKAWLEGLRDTNDVVINKMPEDVPYNVNMDSEESEEEQEAIDENANAELAADVAADEVATTEEEALGSEGDVSLDTTSAGSSE